MRARPNLSGEQLVTDYMTRVAQAARLLPKGTRMTFVGRTRALVERNHTTTLIQAKETDLRKAMATADGLGRLESLTI